MISRLFAVIGGVAINLSYRGFYDGTGRTLKRLSVLMGQGGRAVT